MDLKHKILAGAAAAFFVLAVVAGASWLSAHDDAVRLAAQLKADSEWLKKLGEHEQAIKAEAESRIAQIQAEAAKQKTPQQIATWLPQQATALPTPITVNIPPTPPGQAPSPAEARIPQEDLAPIRDLVAQCQACKVELPAVKTQLADEQQKLVVITKERDAAVVAAKGGSFWHRAGRAAKWLAIGVGVGVVACAASGHC